MKIIRDGEKITGDYGINTETNSYKVIQITQTKLESSFQIKMNKFKILDDGLLINKFQKLMEIKVVRDISLSIKKGKLLVYLVQMVLVKQQFRHSWVSKA